SVGLERKKQFNMANMQQEGTSQERFINEAVPNQSTSCDENYESQTLLEPTLESEISFE
ncbi:11242_t:CDS:2, partial [Cetraspora pellucida]